MCGIICYASNQEKKTSIKKKLQVMQKTQFHRGPDSQKIYTLQNKNYSIGIGFQRLSIIDLNTRSDQPIITEDKRY